MIETLIAKIQQRSALSEEEQELLRSRMTEAVVYPAGSVMVTEGERIRHSLLLAEGLACRSKYMVDGARQIMEFEIAGDFVDLHSYPLERLDHSITAITDCRMIKLQHRDINSLIEQHPRFARILWFMTMVDASIHREWLVSLGSRSGAHRVAHLFCEMFHRSRVVGLTDGFTYDFPVTQADLGEALGFTSVHVNRVLRELRERNLATFQAKRVRIENLDVLEEFAQFDPGYLYLQRNEH